MTAEFAYVQARAQARHGDRLTEETWRALGSSRGLSNYLHSARSTALARHVQYFSATSSPHYIERALRHVWRREVATARFWVPRRWRPAVAWAMWLPYLPAVAHLAEGNPALAWMKEDPILADFRSDLEAWKPAGGGLESWTRRWQALWPATNDAGRSGLMALVSLLSSAVAQRTEVASGRAEIRQRRSDLEMRAARILRMRSQQPVTVFCHLFLCASELLRLREGLLRRALYNDVSTAARA